MTADQSCGSHSNTAIDSTCEAIRRRQFKKLRLNWPIFADLIIVISVEDNGIGMTREFVAHAFEIFSQAARTAYRTKWGLGLGLALVKNLVELDGGQVECSREGLGMGSQSQFGYLARSRATSHVEARHTSNDSPIKRPLWGVSGPSMVSVRRPWLHAADESFNRGGRQRLIRI